MGYLLKTYSVGAVRYSAGSLRYAAGPLKRFFVEEDAATAVEYAVMLALILIAVLSAIGAVAQQAGGMWGNVEGDLNGAGFGS